MRSQFRKNSNFCPEVHYGKTINDTGKLTSPIFKSYSEFEFASSIIQNEYDGKKASADSKKILKKKRKKKTKTDLREKRIRLENSSSCTKHNSSEVLQNNGSGTCNISDRLTTTYSIRFSKNTTEFLIENQEKRGECLLQKKRLIQEWPRRNSNDAKGSTELYVVTDLVVQRRKQNHKKEHSCSGFTHANVVPECCLFSEHGMWTTCMGQKKSSCISRKVKANEVKESRHSSEKKANSNMELPGFYYDAERKRYFKIVSSANNTMSNAMTRERIEFDKKERLRQDELKCFSALPCPSVPKLKTLHSKSSNIVTILEKMQSGLSTPELSTYQVQRCLVAKLQLQAVSKFSELPETKVSKILINRQQNRLMASLRRGAKGNIQLWNIDDFRNTSDSLYENDHCIKVALSHARFSCDFKSSHVTDFCWASEDDQEVDRVLYCSTSSDLQRHNVYGVLCLGSVPTKVFETKVNSAVLSCAWKGNIAAIGMEDCVHRFNASDINSSWKLNTSNTAVNSLAFANMDVNVLFCGTKTGKILMYDERYSHKKPVAYLSNSSCICNLIVTKDNRHLVSADYSGKISKWDLRQGNVVVNYPGHISDYVRTSLIIDQQEEFLSAVGTDSYTRIWDFRSGDTLRIFPPPLPAARDSMPSICFSELYSVQKNNYPGLFLAMSNELYFYSV